MKSATSFFNRGVFVKSVLRFWPIWAIYAFVQLLVLPLNIIAPLSTPVSGHVNQQVIEAAAYVAQYLCPAACCASALAVFAHLYSDRAADFYSVLPVSRRAMFTSLSLAGMLPLLAANVLIFLISLATEAVFGFSGLPALLEWLGAVSLLTAAYFGIAVFCAQLTGHIVVMPILFIAFGVVVSWLGNMALVVPDMFCYGYRSTGAGIADLFSPFVCLPQGIRVVSAAEGVYHLQGWRYLLVYGALGLVLLPASCALYKRRAVESAGDVVAIAPLRPVFQLICSLAAAFILGNLFYTLPFGSSPADGMGQAVVYALCMSAAAFIGWFCAAMLVNKSFAVFKSRLGYAAWAIVSVLCAALVFACELDATGYETRVPDTDDIISVQVSAGGAAATFDEPENIATVLMIHESAIAAREENETAREEGLSITNLYLSYTLTGGNELLREYRIASGGRAQTLDLLETLMNSSEGISERKDPGVAMNASTVVYGQIIPGFETGMYNSEQIELTAGEALELYRDCILPDMRDRTIGLVWYRTDEAYYESVCDCRIEIEVVAPDSRQISFYTVPTIWSERTNAWLAEHGIELKTIAETQNLTPSE